MQTDSVDKHGNVVSTSTTETTSTLTSVNPDRCTLRVDVVVEVAGRRYSTESKEMTLAFLDESPDAGVVVKKKSDASVNVSGNSIPVEVREITVNDKATRRVSTVFYAKQQPPFELRRHTTATNADGKTTHYETQVEVLAVDMPQRILSEIKPASYVRTIHTQAKTSTVTVEVLSPEVPGGVVSHTSKEIDPAGQVTRRSTLELLDYGVGKRTKSHFFYKYRN